MHTLRFYINMVKVKIMLNLMHYGGAQHRIIFNSEEEKNLIYQLDTTVVIDIIINEL